MAEEEFRRRMEEKWTPVMMSSVSSLTRNRSAGATEGGIRSAAIDAVGGSSPKNVDGESAEDKASDAGTAAVHSESGNNERLMTDILETDKQVLVTEVSFMQHQVRLHGALSSFARYV